jgi:hypothetical protein
MKLNFDDAFFTMFLITWFVGLILYFGLFGYVTYLVIRALYKYVYGV